MRNGGPEHRRPRARNTALGVSEEQIGIVFTGLSPGETF